MFFLFPDKLNQTTIMAITGTSPESKHSLTDCLWCCEISIVSHHVKKKKKKNPVLSHGNHPCDVTDGGLSEVFVL